jgi:hypothetical protein
MPDMHVRCSVGSSDHHRLWHCGELGDVSPSVSSIQTLLLIDPSVKVLARNHVE